MVKLFIKVFSGCLVKMVEILRLLDLVWVVVGFGEILDLRVV